MGDREIARIRRRQRTIHWKFGNQREKVPASKYAAIFKLFIELIAAGREVVLNHDREVRVVRRRCNVAAKQADPLDTAQAVTVNRIDHLPPYPYFLEVAQLKNPESSIELAHLSIDSGRHNGDFIYIPEVLQVIDVYLRLPVLADDRAP